MQLWCVDFCRKGNIVRVLGRGENVVRTSALDQDEMEWMTMMLSGRGLPVP